MATFQTPSSATVKAPYAAGSGYYSMAGISTASNLTVEKATAAMNGLLEIAGDEFKVSSADAGKVTRSIIQKGA